MAQTPLVRFGVDSLIKVTCHISMSRICYEHNVRPSVRPAVRVALVDCDALCNKKWKMTG